MIDTLQRELSFDSCSGNERISVRIVEPADRFQVRAVLQIAHGMAEHSLLYMDFAAYMASRGFAVAVNDHLGHGKSVSSGGAYGYFGPGGCQSMVTDMHKLSYLMKLDYPSLPYFLMGHSMGSFLARSYTAQYGNELAGVIYLGTGAGPGPLMLKAQLAFANGVVKKKGPLAHDPMFMKLSTGQFNKAFAPNRTENDWLSRDEKEVDRYTNDPLCGFSLTVSGYRDILALESEINQSGWYRAVPDLPILIASGDKDPVGDFGKGARKVAEGLKKTGRNVTFKLYPGARHVLLCETNKDEVYADIAGFLESILSPEEIGEGEENDG